ncbi:GLPGLI family protein [Chryseobacterium piperi]|uniref:GLPGLI family protein n=1 Tax=Chryseobacterium piperi TaxID=558152 RepID=UPI000AB0EE94|nr:GLPGLI family protein [Chryseobacterium piperi]
MSKNIFFLTLIFLSSLLFSQQKNYSFGYRLEYVPDSTNVLNTRMENFTLFVENGKSYFVSDNFIKRDSIIKTFSNLQNLNFSNTPNTRFKSVLIKNKEKNSLTFYDNVLKYFFSYNESPRFEWKLIDEKQKIGTYSCFKAETEYGGRKWTAWYTKEIPFQDGPYKFNGLPGLIVKISDSENNFTYELSSIKKSNLPENVIFSKKYLEKHKKLSKEDYIKAIKNINENIINELSMSGLKIAPESVEAAKANLKRKNNPIELK